MLTSLRIFADLVEAGSFARAAEANYLTRSAVSQRIRQLEEAMGRRLLLRSRGGAAPTDAGEVFYRACRDILARYEDCRRELDQLRGEVRGSLRVGSVTSVGLHELPRFLKVFLERFPSVDVALEYLSNRDVYRGIADGNLDLGIVAFPTRNPAVVTVPFRRDELVVIVPPGHPLARSRSIKPERLGGQPFVAFEHGVPTGRVVERLLRGTGTRIRIVHRFDNVETIKRAVEIGAGVSIVPSETVRQETEAGTLVSVRLRGADWWRPIAAIHRKGRPPGPAAQAFLAVLSG